ncbi:ISL3 family transposase [Zavarzinella formosa]|uniref:ISL3 family transposase n=1 Tax=Zavarzinella formosa TaxID=360055 RepID=UPI00030D83BB|nr:ISL3 family transposase [Zavarzinella formosa]
MSSTPLYRAFGIRDYQVVRTASSKAGLTLHLRQGAARDRCSACQSVNVIRHGTVERTIRTLPVGGQSVDLCLPVPRLGCRDCGLVRQAAIRFARPFRRLTHALERYALDLLGHMTIQAVAEHLKVGWDAIKDLFKCRLQARFGQPKLKRLKRIAIDEISVGHGHRYLTVVLDLNTGAVVFIGQGKGADALNPFWKRLRAAHAKIHAVATDMSPAYLFAVRENLPKAVHVFDHFHVVKLFNERLSDFRRDLQREAEGPPGKTVLKGTRWLILKNPENLDEARGERTRLEEALRINQPLATAYYMKEEFRHFWEQDNLKDATRFLDDWCRRAEASKLSVLQKTASSFQMHRTGLLNYHRCPISTGPLQGVNNKIKTLQRQAYGYRDQEFFHLRIYSIHRAKYELVG